MRLVISRSSRRESYVSKKSSSSSWYEPTPVYESDTPGDANAAGTPTHVLMFQSGTPNLEINIYELAWSIADRA